MIREDRELLTELARLNTAMTPFAMRLMDGSASTAEQRTYARRLIAAGQWLQRRAEASSGVVIDGEVCKNRPLAIPAHTVEPYWES